ncbi:four helix bundle protein [Alcanivorax sp. PA15-N-34]|uniref:Four helix bundle protein n=1 Tax=Alcanivorax sediminis TaxID=2663008 RepID=A0A6N7LQQ2_9GAMM|nr:four helix bundle protein [Alcanivorax sediminis]
MQVKGRACCKEVKSLARRYQNLRVWQAAMEMAEAAYGVVTHFPDSERFGLVQQMQRSALSVPSNIAEGYGRGGDVEFRRFLRIARGSLFELETQLIVAERLGYGSRADLEPLIEKVFALLSGMLRKLEGA